MNKLTRRAVLRTSAGFAAAGVLARPHIANAQAKTIEVWFGQGFVPEEDAALNKLVADYQKASGNKVDLSIVPFAPLRQKEVSAITSGLVPDVMEAQDLQFIPLQAWQDALLDVSDIVETQKSHFADHILISVNLYDNAKKKRSYYGVPMKTFATPFHIWGSLIEKAGFKTSDLPKTWDAFIDFFKPVQAKLREQGMRHTYATGFVVSTIGVDPINTFNAFTVAYGGQDMVTKDGKYHGRDPHVREALIKMLTTLSKMFKESYIPPSSINWNDADDNNAFHSKLCVMDYDGSLSTELPHLKNKQEYEHDIITGPLPLSNDGKQLPVQSGVFGPVIPKGAKNVEVAREFLKYAIQPEVLNEYLKGGLGRWANPMPETVKTDPWWLDPSDTHRSTHTKMASGMLGPMIPWYEAYNPAIAQVNAEHVYQVAFSEIISGGSTPQQAVDKAITRIEGIFAKYPIPAA
jgi:multiple sugar transport system substrate-binding protein